MFFVKLLIYQICINCYFISAAPSIPALKDGSKYAFVQTSNLDIHPRHVNMEMTEQDEVSVHWPKGIVRYQIDSESYGGSLELRWVFKYIEERSCIKFEELPERPTDNSTWLYITNPMKQRECSHGVRYMSGGEIMLVLGYDCMDTDGLLHTLLHGVGMKDEVTHPHRDKYIRVLWDNIQPAYRHLFRKRAAVTTENIIEYDPLSIMHFHDRAFSLNGRATLVPLDPGLVIKPSEDLSQLDQMKLQMYFGHECNKRKVDNILDTCKMTFKAMKSNLDEKKSQEKQDKTGKEGSEDSLNKSKQANTEEKQLGTEKEENGGGNDDMKGDEDGSEDENVSEKHIADGKSDQDDRSKEDRETISKGQDESKEDRETIGKEQDESKEDRETISKGQGESKEDRETISKGQGESKEDMETISKGQVESKEDRETMAKRQHESVSSESTSVERLVE